MTDAIIKYLPVIGVLVILGMLALYLRSRAKAQAMSQVAPLQPRTGGVPPVAEVVRYSSSAVPSQVIELAQTTGAKIAVQTEKTYDEVDRLLALESRRGGLEDLRKKLGLPADPKTNNAILGNWDEVRRDRGPQTEFLTVVQAGIDKLKADKAAKDAASPK